MKNINKPKVINYVRMNFKLFLNYVYRYKLVIKFVLALIIDN